MISLRHVTKEYRLGQIGYGTLNKDLQSWWAKRRNKPDPNAKIGKERRLEDGRLLALNDITLDFYQGECVGIIGGNGAGKSTLLKLISRVTVPTAGSIDLYGRVTSMLEVGIGFHGEMTGRENIFMNGAILGMTRNEIQAKLDEIIDFSGCERYIDTPVKRYSSGMTVRLGFAVAAFLDPEILVVDEVLAVGDAEFQKKAIGKMKDVSQGEGRTVLFVSHNMDSILNLCKSGMWLDKGMVKYQGSAADVVGKYLGANVQGFKYVNVNPQGGLYVTEMSFVGNERQQKGNFMFDESIKLFVHIHKDTNYVLNPSTMFGLTLYNRGKRLCTMEHDLKELKDNSEMEMIFSFPPSLFAPGDLYFEMAIHIPNVEFIHHEEEVCALTISDSGTDFLKYMGVDSGAIIVTPNIEISVK